MDVTEMEKEDSELEIYNDGVDAEDDSSVVENGLSD